jgi:hypothetical protein
VYTNFQDGRRRHIGNSSVCYKMGNYHLILMEIATQTKTDMLRSKVTKRKLAEKTAKIKCKKRYRFKRATLYEREVIKKQKFFIRWQKLPYSYNR